VLCIKGDVLLQAVNTYRGVELTAQHTYATSVYDVKGYSASRSDPLTPRKKIPVPIKDRMGPRAILDILEKRKISYSCPESNHDSFVFSLLV
jgi:hypothetical protein